jgi:tetratricopeptide (TPR) repeat protein
LNPLRILPAVLILATLPLSAQRSSSSSSSDNSTPLQDNSISSRRGVEQAGSAITLETNEALFTIAAGLNACGYDADLERSLPVRRTIRGEIDVVLGQSAEARASRDALCVYVKEHTLGGALNLSQYISLALFTTQPPELTPSVSELELPPDSTPVVNMLPLIRTFAESINLHEIWLRHRPEYEAAVARVHDPLTKVMLDTNVYLRQPVSTYEGRRFLILLEPMLSPAATNARIYGTDYFVVASPSTPTPDKPNDAGVHLDDIRHSYLHYMVEPLVYARASSTDRLLPILRTVQEAPLEFIYKNDIVALVTECLIKAIEARTMDVGFPKPAKPINPRSRQEIDRYNIDIIDYDKRADIVRRRLVAADMRQGWVITQYLYEKLSALEGAGASLREDIGEMVYGMDVYHEVNTAKQIQFDAVGSHELVARSNVPRNKVTGLDLAEQKLFQRDANGAEALAKAELVKNPNSDRALYLLARVDLLRRNPEEAVDKLHKVVEVSRDPHISAWAHVYLGRLYDTLPDRDQAVEEYKAALATHDPASDTHSAAEAGLKKPFSTPKIDSTAPAANDDIEPLDPTGKKQKESYKPPTR